ncbi:copper transport protein ctr1 [Ancistrocladus abbreviatus]
MEMPGRRSNYSLVSQVEDQPPQPAAKFSGAGGLSVPSYESSHNSGEKNKAKRGGGGGDRSVDWDGVSVSDQRSRVSGMFTSSSIGLQRQSSGSSFGESSLSGDYYVPSISMATGDSDGFGYVGGGGGGGGELRLGLLEGTSSSSKSWAQQTEESYQLQLALALRLSSEATCADDPNFLDPVPDDSASRCSSSASAESISHRFWVNGCLSYFDKVPDGFYMIHGVDPYVWSVCTDLQENGRIPSIESLKSIESSDSSPLEVVLIDRQNDSSLKELQNRVNSISCSCTTPKDVVDQLAKLVCNHMGGAASVIEDEFLPIWKGHIDDLKDCVRSVVLPIGSLSYGLCRHRALLFKVLADTIDLPCRIARGCKYCRKDDAMSCLVRFGLDREYLVDLIEKPGGLCRPNSLLNGPSSISISSPLRFPRFRPVELAIDSSRLAKQYFSDCQSLNIVFEEVSTGTVGYKEDVEVSVYHKQSDRKDQVSSSFMNAKHSQLPLPSKAAQPAGHEQDSLLFASCNPSQNTGISSNMVRAPINSQLVPPSGQKGVYLYNGTNNSWFFEGNQLVPNKPRESALEMEDLVIPWTDLVLKEKIGAGSFGTVHRAEWHGSEVAVKILMEQDFHAERCKEFLREIAIMKRLRHPNIVLFMGAVTQPPNLSIVTEYLAKGCLYRLLHKSGERERLDERRRLNMAYDVAKGMNYLHKRNPPIVHRDLKSPNLLVDRKYAVKVCDFGLSRLKANTFLSSKSAAGTPEWMAPEVLRDEQSNEKSDVYSFGVILWELATLEPPWNNLNPAQVVAAVGFKGKRLEIPRHVNPDVAAIIEACWANEPGKRPSFAKIMDSLRTIIKPPAPQPLRADMQLT